MSIYFLYIHTHTQIWASRVALLIKNPPDNAGDVRDMGSIPGSGRSSGGGHGNPLQYSWTEESGRLPSMRWQSRTRLSD